MKTLSSFLLLAVLLSGCSPKLSADHNWAGRRWVLTEMKGVPVQLSGSRRDAYLEFVPADKRFEGNAGCNRVSGTYTLDKKKLGFGSVMSTKMSCPDIAFENTFLEVLKQVDRYEMNMNTLSLKDGSKTVLSFDAK